MNDMVITYYDKTYIVLGSMLNAFVLSRLICTKNQDDLNISPAVCLIKNRQSDWTKSTSAGGNKSVYSIFSISGCMTRGAGIWISLWRLDKVWNKVSIPSEILSVAWSYLIVDWRV